MTRDQAFAEGWRLGWRGAVIGAVTILLGAAAICALGAWLEMVEQAHNSLPSS